MNVGSLISAAFFGILIAMVITILVLIGRQVWKFALYRIPFIVLQNAGGGTDNKSISLHPKIKVLGRVVQSIYGPRLRIWGEKETRPLQLLSREHAIPWRGRFAYILYEKEPGQYFPNAVAEVNEKKNPEAALKIRTIMESIKKKMPDVAGYFHMVDPGKTAVPVGFANTEVKLRPIPMEAITPFMYDLKARNSRVVRPTRFQQLAPFIGLALVVGCFILGLVLFLDYMKDMQTAAVSEFTAAQDSMAEKIAKRVREGGESAPGSGSIFIPLLPFLLRRRKQCLGS